MLIKGNSAKIELVTSSGADIDVALVYYQHVDAATYADGKPVHTKITTAATTTICAGVGDTTSQRIGSVQIKNIDAAVSNTVECRVTSDSGVGLDAGLVVSLWTVTLLPGESMTYNGHNWAHNPANYGTFTPVVLALAGDQSNSTVTPTEVTGLSVVSVQPGVYTFDYYILYNSGVTTTGVRFDVNFTGTVTSFVWNQYWSDLSATAATAVPDQDNIGAAGHVMASFASRAKGTAGRGTTLSTDSAGSDMLMRIEGLMIVTVAGDLELWHGSEVAAISTIKAGTSLVLTKTG